MKPSFEPVVLGSALLALFWVVLPLDIQRTTGDAGPTCAPTASPRTVTELERCLVLAPRDVDLLAELAAAYDAAGDTARAEQLYQQALAHDPSYGDVRLRLAQLLLRQGAYTEAEAQARAALDAQPNRQALRDVLARAQARRAAHR